MRHLVLCVIAVAFSSAAESDARFLPSANLIHSKFVADHLMGASLQASGIVGSYRDRHGTYQLMLVRLPNNEKAAFLLLDVKKMMIAPHYLAHMGGFAGQKDGTPFYVFAKGPFVAAIAGKPEAEAEVLARVFAGRLPLK